MINDEVVLAFDNYVKASSMGTEKKYSVCRKFLLDYINFKTQELSMPKQRMTISYMMSIFMKLSAKGIVNLHVLQSLTSMAVRVMYYQEAVLKASIPSIVQRESIMDFQKPIVLLEEISSKLCKTNTTPEMTMAKDLLL